MNTEFIKQKLKSFFSQNIKFALGSGPKYLIVGATSSLVTLLLVGAAAWNFRGDIFGYFASEYLKTTAVLGTTNNQDADPVTQQVTEELANIVASEPEISSDLRQQASVIETVKQTNPAVVSIIITKEVPKYEVYETPAQNPFGDLLPGFNINIPQYRQNGTEKKEIGGGSGFFVSSDGLIVTNKHVVAADGVEYSVYTNDGKKYPAEVVARDQVLDIALVKVVGSGFQYLSLGNSDGLEVGQTVIAIGNALAEFKNSVSVGVISGLSRSITAGDNSGKTELLDKVIQTDAAINPGNSGGPLLDLYGKVVGVNVAVAQGSENIGFALPINGVKDVIESVKKTGKIIRPYIGIRYVVLSPEIAAKNNLPVDYGVLLKSGNGADESATLPDSPAQKAGLVEGDIILSIDGVKLDDGNNLATIIRNEKVGTTVRLQILRDGLNKTIFVKLEAAKD